MIRTYISYSFSLLSAFMVWWLIGLFSTVAAGYNWIPYSAFLASIFQFGITSWLFFYFPKFGNILSILSTTIMCIWPIIGFISYVKTGEAFFIIYFLIVLVLSGTIIYNHIKTMRSYEKKRINRTRVILSLIPFGIFIWYILAAYKYFI